MGQFKLQNSTPRESSHLLIERSWFPWLLLIASTLFVIAALEQILSGVPLDRRLMVHAIVVASGISFTALKQRQTRGRRKP
jgi:ABC-type Na+ efflux pump permease subunit